MKAGRPETLFSRSSTGNPRQPSSVVGPTKLIEFHVERAWHGHADAQHALALEFAAELFCQPSDLGHGLVRPGPFKGPVFARDNGAGEIDQRRLQSARRHMNADGMGAGGIDGEAGRRRPPSARFATRPFDEALRLQLVGDIGNSLYRKPHTAGDFGPLHRSVQPDGFKHDAPVVGTSEFLVRTFEGDHVSNPRPATRRD